MKQRIRVVRTSISEQSLVKEWLFKNIVVFKKTLDSEDIPEHVLNMLSCFGDAGGWISKFAPFDKNGRVG